MDRGQMWSHKDVTCFIHIWSKHISILVKKIVLYKKCTSLQPAFVLVMTLVVFPPAAGSFYWIMTWMTGNVHRHLPCRLNLLRFQTLQVHFAARILLSKKSYPIKWRHWSYPSCSRHPLLDYDLDDRENPQTSALLQVEHTQILKLN